MSTKTVHLPNLVDKSQLERFDNQRMYKTYDSWPEIAVDAYESSLEQIDYKDISHIVFAGMGGSGAINDIFSSILSKTGIHVTVVKGYHLPRTVKSDSLVVATSASGNTVETLTVLDSANQLGCKTISFSYGGKMEQFCKKHGLEYRNVWMPHSPRASLPSFLYSMLRVLEPVLPIKKEEVTESISQLEQTKREISSSNLSETNPALELAKWITGIPLVYYPYGLEATAIRFKNSLQENAKSHIIIEEILEASHNGIVSWEIPSKIQPILMQGRDDHIQTKQRWKIFKSFFDERGIDYKEVFSLEGSILTKLINLNYLLDYSTIYRAVLSKIDPSPVLPIDYIKQILWKNENNHISI